MAATAESMDSPWAERVLTLTPLASRLRSRTSSTAVPSAVGEMISATCAQRKPAPALPGPRASNAPLRPGVRPPTSSSHRTVQPGNQDPLGPAPAPLLEVWREQHTPSPWPGPSEKQMQAPQGNQNTRLTTAKAWRIKGAGRGPKGLFVAVKTDRAWPFLQEQGLSGGLLEGSGSRRRVLQPIAATVTERAQTLTCT